MCAWLCVVDSNLTANAHFNTKISMHIHHKLLTPSSSTPHTSIINSSHLHHQLLTPPSSTPHTSIINSSHLHHQLLTPPSTPHTSINSSNLHHQLLTPPLFPPPPLPVANKATPLAGEVVDLIGSRTLRAASTMLHYSKRSVCVTAQQVINGHVGVNIEVALQGTCGRTPGPSQACYVSHHQSQYNNTVHSRTLIAYSESFCFLYE